jgi:hypothetical protein
MIRPDLDTLARVDHLRLQLEQADRLIHHLAHPLATLQRNVPEFAVEIGATAALDAYRAWCQR